MKTTTGTAYLLLACAGLMSVGCTQQEDGPMNERGDRTIAFGAEMSAAVSRSEVATVGNLEGFYVTAFNPSDPGRLLNGTLVEHFSDQFVRTAPGSRYYKSAGCVWPSAGMERDELSFYAYAPAKNAGAAMVNESTPSRLVYRLEGFRVAEDIAEQVDFITAYTTGSMAENLSSGIVLPFNHQLSRVELRAWSANKSCDIEIAGVRICGVNLEGAFDFTANDNRGTWGKQAHKGSVEYVYGRGDRIVALRKGEATTSTEGGAVSIMGNALPDGNNAMLIPCAYPEGWAYDKDRNNAKGGMYIGVLLRILDATATAGVRPENTQRYPYQELTGEDGLKIPRVYLVVEKATDTVTRRVYKRGEVYDASDADFFEDADCTVGYVPAPGEEVREFGWSYMPVTADWKAGRIYTYTLDFSFGVGLHGPEVTTTAPGAGDPVVRDQVGMGVTVEEWKVPAGPDTPPLVVPGS